MSRFPAAFAAAFGGPRHGLAGLRARVGAGRRPLTATAIKPQGLPVPALAALAHRLALGGLDYIKDDHSHADQAFSPFAERVPAIAEAVRRATAGNRPANALCAHAERRLGAHAGAVAAARDCGIDTVMMAPMLSGVATLQAIAREWPEMAILAHPSMSGGGQIAPDLLFGTLFRLWGADALIFANYGGRFGFSPADVPHACPRGRWRRCTGCAQPSHAGGRHGTGASARAAGFLRPRRRCC